MKYLVAVLANRFKAESAYTALEQEQVPVKQVSILGEGYQSADSYGLIDPDQQASKQSRRLMLWVAPLGFVAGYVFNVSTGIEIFSQLSPLANHLIGGVLGALSGVLGAYIAGAIGGWIGSGDALAYRNRLNAGKYLVIAEGDDRSIRQATQVLRQFEPEAIQGYVEA